MQVWLNGQLEDRNDARVSAFDAAVQHGVGLFETMRAFNGRVYRLEAHLARLANSADELRLTKELNVEPLAEAVRRTVEASGLSEARVRLTITGGDLNLLQSERRSPLHPTLLIVAQPPTTYPEAMYETGVTAVVADGRLNPFDPLAGHKTINYWTRLHALQTAAGHHAAEAIWFSVTNHLMSGSVSNLFLVRDGVLMTPIAHGEEVQGALPAPVLPGITRAAILEFAEDADIESRRQMLDINDLTGASEAFLTNSSWGVLPLVRVSMGEQAATIGDGSPGPITRQLRQAYLNDVASQTGG